MRAIEHIVLHTAASYDAKRKEVVHLTRDAIDAYHREHNGWREIGYHWYVEEGGRGRAANCGRTLNAIVAGATPLLAETACGKARHRLLDAWLTLRTLASVRHRRTVAAARFFRLECPADDRHFQGPVAVSPTQSNHRRFRSPCDKPARSTPRPTLNVSRSTC
jgi:hypothetical protein